MRSFIVIVLSVCCCAVAGAQGITLELKFKTGQVSRYKSTTYTQLTMHLLSDSTSEESVERYTTERVESVNSLGTAELTLVQDSVHSLRGQKRLPYSDADVLTALPMKVTITKLGKVLSVEAMKPLSPESKKAFDAFSDGLQKNPAFPQYPIRPKESWDDEIILYGDSPMGQAKETIHRTNTLVGFETLAGYNCVRIQRKGTLTGTLPVGQMKISGTVEGLSLFADREGKEVKDYLDINASMTIAVQEKSIGMTMRVTATKELLP